MYCEMQQRIDITWERLLRIVASSRGANEPYRKFDLLTRALTFSPPRHVHQLLQEYVLPEFFQQVPDASVQVLLIDEEIEKDFAVLRGGYALEHYSPAELGESQVGFGSLRAWEMGHPQDYVDPVLSILQVGTYPYIPLFHGGPYGLTFVFFFPQLHLHELDVFPVNWLHWARSDAVFGAQDIDRIRGLSDSESEEHLALAHRRYRTPSPPSPAAYFQLTNWLLSRLSVIIREAADPANFETSDGFIDFTFALEHSLSMVRVLKRTLLSLATQEPPVGKFVAFEVADLLDTLATAFSKRKEGETFKLLFNPDEGQACIKACVKGVPEDARALLDSMTEALYRELRETVRSSIWVRGKLHDDTVLVKAKSLADENGQSLAGFTANLMRALRNTHHGYLTRLDPAQRPSRYLALSTGDVPDSLSQLPFVWTIALLSNPERLVGWKTLEAGYE